MVGSLSNINKIFVYHADPECRDSLVAEIGRCLNGYVKNSSAGELEVPYYGKVEGTMLNIENGSADTRWKDIPYCTRTDMLWNAWMAHGYQNHAVAGNGHPEEKDILAFVPRINCP